MKRIAITGASGFLGINLIKNLIADGRFELFLYTTAAHKLNHLRDAMNIRIYETDYSCQSLAETFIDYNAVVHLAAKRMIPTQNDLSDYLANVTITDNLLNVCDKFETGIFILASSQSVYDSARNKVPFSEDELPIPLNEYAASKLACENLLSKYRTRSIALRFAQLIGWEENKDYFFNLSLKKIMKQEPVTIWGDGSGRRDYLYVNDAVEMIKMAIENDISGIYNVGSGTALSFSEIIETMASVFKYESKITFDKTKTTIPEVRYMNIEKAKKVFGWEPAFSFKAALIDLKNKYNHEEKLDKPS